MSFQDEHIEVHASGQGGACRRPSVAVLIPCHNEEASIGKVVRDFRSALPFAPIFVYDNNSTDRTLQCAHAAGAIVCSEPLQGKGNVVRRMFADIDADVFVLVDGDDTYDASCAPMLVARLLRDRLDMVNASRVATSQDAYRRGHRFGNAMLTSFVSYAFGKRQSDLMSGYRVLSRRFVKSFPAIAAGFEVETELTVHALELRLPLAEIQTPYRERPPGGASKLRTYRDGMLILSTIVRLIKEEKPLQFFALGFAILAASSVGLEIPVLNTYLHTGLVPRLPTALLGTGLMLLAFLSLTCGLILDTVTRGRIELKRLHYLQLPLDRFDPEWIERLEKPRH